MNKITEDLQNEVQWELENNILPFWMNRMIDNEYGGFHGQITGNGQRVVHAPKGAILNARILWTFSAAYRLLRKPEYLETATRAKRYLIDKFYDQEFEGIYWELDYTGQPVQTKKQIYALGFAIYGLSEYNRATGDKEALDYAIRLFKAIEQYSFDPEKNGYMEAFTKDWKLIEDMRLSDKDENEKKTMNTHLHILEPYTNLYRVWKDEHLKKQLRNLILIFTDKILDHRTYHLNLFFNEDWESKYRIISYGHDIEASWLLHEAAIELGDNEILQKVEPLVQKIAIAAEDGLLANGSLIYEYHPDEKKADTDLHWWVQAENVVGHFNLYQHFGDEPALGTAYTCWKFIQRYLIDKEQGEWHWSVSLDHEINREDDKSLSQRTDVYGDYRTTCRRIAVRKTACRLFFIRLTTVGSFRHQKNKRYEQILLDGDRPPSRFGEPPGRDQAASFGRRQHGTPTSH